jgi:hypothetical protein
MASKRPRTFDEQVSGRSWEYGESVVRMSSFSVVGCAALWSICKLRCAETDLLDSTMEGATIEKERKEG